MKYAVYVITYFAYAMNHACRMTLAYNKPNIKNTFGFSPVHLGVLDALVYIAYGVGTFFRFAFFGEHFLTKMYLISAMLISSFFAIIPFLSICAEDLLKERLSNKESITEFDALIAVSLVGYGFSQLATWQIILSLMSKYWNIKKEGQYMGFWTSMTCVGNIMAFTISNFMITELGLRWELTMFLFAVLNLFAALLMYFYISDPIESEFSIEHLNEADHDEICFGIEKEEEKDITTKECFEFNKNKFFATWDFRLYIFTATCQKILNYSFLMWYPTFLYIQGFERISGYITTLFDISSILGSFLVGKINMYDKATCRRCGVEQSESNVFLFVMNVLLKLKNVLIMCFSVAMGFLFLENFGSLLANVLITILLGCTIGGILHVNATFNSFTLGEHIPRNVDMVTSFSTGFGTVILGLVQLIIGLVVNSQIPENTTEREVRHIKAWSYRNLFKFLICIMMISAVLMFFRAAVWKMSLPKKEEAKSSTEEQKSLDFIPIPQEK